MKNNNKIGKKEALDKSKNNKCVKIILLVIS